MSARVTIDGVPNEPVSSLVLERLVEPILDLLGGVDVGDLAYLRIDRSGIKAKVAARNRRGRRLPDSWAHLAVRVVDDREEER